MTLHEATVAVVVVDIVVVVIAAVFVTVDFVALLVVTDHIVFTFGQLMFI